MPISQSPPSTIRGILSDKSSKTSNAVVGLGLPDQFAEGAANGPVWEIISKAVL